MANAKKVMGVEAGEVMRSELTQPKHVVQITMNSETVVLIRVAGKDRARFPANH